MKRLLTAVLLLFTVSGCTLTSEAPTRSLIATIAIQTAVSELILRDEHTAAETSTKVVEIAEQALLLVESGEVTTLTLLDTRIRERITELNLEPTKALLVDTLLLAINARVRFMIEDKHLTEDTVIKVSKVLNIIVATAKRYNE